MSLLSSELTSYIVSLHHTSYVLYLTSYIVHRTSYIVHRTSYIVHRTSFIVHRSSFIVHLTSHIVHRTSHIVHRTSYIVHRTSLIVHRTSFIVHRSSFISHRISYIVRLTSYIVRLTLHISHRTSYIVHRIYIVHRAASASYFYYLLWCMYVCKLMLIDSSIEYFSYHALINFQVFASVLCSSSSHCPMTCTSYLSLQPTPSARWRWQQWRWAELLSFSTFSFTRSLAQRHLDNSGMYHPSDIGDSSSVLCRTECDSGVGRQTVAVTS